MGPVEYLVIEFPGNQFKGEIVPALAEITGNGTIRIIDLLFVRKDESGDVTSFELEAMDDEAGALFNDLDGEIYDLLNEEDVAMVADSLRPDSSAAILVFEHTWATRLRDAIVGANGRLVENGRIPPEIVEAALAAVTD